MRMLARALLVGATAATLSLALTSALSAKEVNTRRTPALEKQLQSRYRQPEQLFSPTFTGPMPSLPGAYPTASAKNLADLLAIEKRFYSAAEITGCFYDFRAVSRYRARAGLHLGYDIAMPYGTPAAAGWPGVVTSVVVWSGEEHGITVVSPDGTRVTYGHLLPKVTVGQQILPGQIVGTIARDHVDVKMRNAQGEYVDFGAGAGMPQPSVAFAKPLPRYSFAYNPSSLSTRSGPKGLKTGKKGPLLDLTPPEPPKESLLTAWLVALNTRDLAKEELERLNQQAYLRKVESEQLKKQVTSLEENARLMKQSLDTPELKEVRQKYAQLQIVRSIDQKQIRVIEGELKKARNSVASARKTAEARGLSYADVEAMISQAIATDKSLAESVDAYRKEAKSRDAARLVELQGQVNEASSHLRKLEEMQRIGGVDQVELQSAKEKLRVLQSQLRVLKPTPHDWFFRSPDDEDN